MSTNKFLTIVTGGVQRLVTAISSSAGAGDANKIIATDSTGKIDSTLFPTGLGAETVSMTASENLSAGHFVNVWLDSGTPKVRKADASNGRDANGFVLAAVTSGNAATVYQMGNNNQLSSLTADTLYYLSATTAGTPTATAPSTSGQIIQELGTAFSSSSIPFVDRGYIEIA